MLANGISMNKAGDGAINLGGNGSTLFVPITQPADNVINETHCPHIVNVARVQEINADNGMADTNAIMDDAISTLANDIVSPSDAAVPILPPQPLLQDPAPLLDSVSFPMDDVSVNLETQQNYDGSLDALENKESNDAKNAIQRKCMKNKDQQIIVLT